MIKTAHYLVVDGMTYHLTLTPEEFQTLTDTLQPYLEHAVIPQIKRKANSDLNVEEVRIWAREHGLAVSSHGRLPKMVLQAYREAHSS